MKYCDICCIWKFPKEFFENNTVCDKCVNLLQHPENENIVTTYYTYDRNGTLIEKWCNHCRKFLTIDNFHKNKLLKHNLTVYCKNCFDKLYRKRTGILNGYFTCRICGIRKPKDQFFRNGGYKRGTCNSCLEPKRVTISEIYTSDRKYCKYGNHYPLLTEFRMRKNKSIPDKEYLSSYCVTCTKKYYQEKVYKNGI